MASSRVSTATLATASVNGPKRASNNLPKKTGPTWEELRKEARNLENEIDYKLITFSKIAASLKDQDNAYSSFASDRDPLLSQTSKRFALEYSITVCYVSGTMQSKNFSPIFLLSFQ